MKEHSVINVGDNNDELFEDVSHWTPDQVKKWFKENGYKEFEVNLSNGHSSINGEKLLSLSRNDLQKSPFHLTDLDEVDHLNSCIEALRKDQLAKYMKKGRWNESHVESTQHVGNGRASNGNTYSEYLIENGNANHYSKTTTPLLADEDGSNHGSNVHVAVEPYPSELVKTAIALMYLLLGFTFSAIMLQFVHERVPTKEEDPPLPDIFFDVMPKRIEWAFDVCESAGMVLVIFLFFLYVFHKHRHIICRRVFFIMGTLYLYRSCTMFVTTLPVPGMHFQCAPKAHGKISLMMSRAASLLFGGGLTVTGSHNLCGDYLFSGHTIVLVSAYLVLTEYTPKRWWWLHWLCWVLAAVGILCILLAHDHYSIDVVVAYLLTTRLFWSYHTMCNTGALKDTTRSNLLSRAWWFPLFRYFEGNVSANGRLPRQFEWPFPWPQRLRRIIGHVRRTPIKGI